MWILLEVGSAEAINLVSFVVLSRILTPADYGVAAIAGVVRWAVLAEATSTLAAAMVEPLHGLTFALQHLACMRLIGAIVPPELTATAQAFYSTVAVGAATAVLNNRGANRLRSSAV